MADRAPGSRRGCRWARSPTASSRSAPCSRPGSSSRSAPTSWRGSPRPSRAGAPRRRSGSATAAIHYPDETAIIDERGALTFEELHRRSNALAHAFADEGIGHGDGVGIMCRNHRGFIEATLACAKLGASALYLNTMFAGPQLAEVTRARGRRRRWSTTRSSPACSTDVDGGRRAARRLERGGRRRRTDARRADRARRRARTSSRPPTSRRFVILTSGTTGTPEGRPARQPRRPRRRSPRCSRQDPLPRARDDDDRGAALPLLGLLPLRPQPAARLDDGPAPPLRPRGDAARRSPSTAPRCWRWCR